MLPCLGTHNSRNYNNVNTQNNIHTSNNGVYKGQKKERPFYTHCNFHGHAVDRCYKIHGYSHSYKVRNRDNMSYTTTML